MTDSVPTTATYPDIIAAAAAKQLAAITPVVEAVQTLQTAVATAQAALAPDNSSLASQFIGNLNANVAAFSMTGAQLVATLTPPSS